MRIEFNHLTCTYPAGPVTGLDDLTASVDGRVVGVLGHNGSGKTTLIRIMAGVMPASSGEVFIDGVRPVAQRLPLIPSSAPRFSFFPQEMPNFPLAQTPRQTLEHSLILAGATDSPSRSEMAAGLLDMVGLGAVADRAVSTFSGGMKQKVRIAQSLVHNPTALVLDEPTTGLDVRERLTILRLLHRLSVRVPVVFSTHDCYDAAAVCDVALILARGRLMAHGSPEDLTARVSGQVWEWWVSAVEAVQEDGAFVTRLHKYANGVRVRAVSAVPPPGATAVPPTLEDAYALLTQDAQS
ncbi:MAG TPA: ABC transporter ATP-binding protein [bacterium]|jgi:ABC-type multidrug transport system ATPase subunit